MTLACRSLGSPVAIKSLFGCIVRRFPESLSGSIKSIGSDSFASAIFFFAAFSFLTASFASAFCTSLVISVSRLISIIFLSSDFNWYLSRASWNCVRRLFSDLCTLLTFPFALIVSLVPSVSASSSASESGFCASIKPSVSSLNCLALRSAGSSFANMLVTTRSKCAWRLRILRSSSTAWFFSSR
uniref:Uncharacterized protein n=1 Tax=Anopheles darlingi TaxID=43151 RepID=A0A2M4CK84_ANODA